MRERQIESLFDNYPCPLLQNKNRYENYYPYHDIEVRRICTLTMHDNCLNRTAFSIIYEC